MNSTAPLPEPKGDESLAGLVLGEVAGLVSFWPEVRGDEEFATGVARDLLAAWAHARRFPPRWVEGSPWAGAVSELERLIAAEGAAMAGRLPVFPAGRWSEGVEWLRAACDAPADREREDEAARLATLLFDELDRHDLATYAARRLVAADSAVEALGRAVRAAEDQLTHEPELFRAAAPLAVALLGLYRDDLGEFDPALFQTTLKHGRLEELLDELGARPALPRIVPPRCEPRPTDPWPILSQPTLSLAAASSAFDPLARLRAELAVRESPVPGVPGLAVSLDVVAHRDVLAHRDRPPDVQVRLRGPDDARGRFGTATLAVPGGPELTAELIRGRGRFPVHPDQLAAGGWRLTLTDRGGRAYLIDREE